MGRILDTGVLLKSAAAGIKSGQSDQIRNFEKANIEPRPGVDEYRMSK
jgi:hypothetical protein